jgi:O-antigen/teichoic acid export membrane protein
LKLSAQFLLTALSKSTDHVSIFVLSVILSRFFTKDDYGTYLHVQLITNLAVWAFLLGIPHGIYYFLPKAKSAKVYVLSILSMISTIAVLVSTCVFYNASGLSQFLSNPRIEDLSYVLLFMILFKIPLTIFEPLLITVGRIKQFASVEVMFNLSFFIAVLIPVMLDSSMIEILWWLVGLYSIHAMVVMCITLSIAFTYRSDEQHHEAFTLNDQVRYSLPLGLSTNVLELSRYVDKLMVSNQSSSEDYAMYTRGAMEIPVIGIIANTLDNLHMPNFVRYYKDNNISELMRVWHTSVRFMAAFIYPCCLFLIVSAPLLIPAIFSDKYIESVIIFQVYTIGMLSRISTFDIILRVIGKTRIILIAALMSIVVNITLTYSLMAMWGLIGAPIATVITLFFMRLTYLIAITQHFKISLSQVFPWGSLGKSLLSAMLSTLPVFLIYTLELGVWIHLLLMGCAFSVSYLIIMKFINALNEDDKRSLKDMLPKKLSWII